MEEKVVKEDKKDTNCKEIIHIKEEHKSPCYLQDHTTFIKKEIKTEELDHDCTCAESSMKFTDYPKVKSEETDITKLPLSNAETFYDEESVDIRSKNESLSSCLNTGVQFQSYLCVLCNTNLFSCEKLKSHLEYHLKKKIHQCQLCDYTTSHKGLLKRHIDGKHKKLKPHQCHICNFTTAQKSGLKMHIDSVHNQLKPHECPICDYTTTQKGNLKLHIDSIHKELKPHKCPNCDYTTSQKGNLKLHIDSIHK